MADLRVVEETRDAGLVHNEHEIALREQAQTHRMAWFRESRATVGVAACGVAVVALYVAGHAPLAERLMAMIGIFLFGAAMRQKPPTE